MKKIFLVLASMLVISSLNASTGTATGASGSMNNSGSGSMNNGAPTIAPGKTNDTGTNLNGAGTGIDKDKETDMDNENGMDLNNAPDSTITTPGTIDNSTDKGVNSNTGR